MIDLASVGLEFDTSGVEQGERKIAQSFANVGTSAEKMAQAVDKATLSTRGQLSASEQVTAALEKRRAVMAQQENQAANEAAFYAQRAQRVAQYSDAERQSEQQINAVAEAQRKAAEAITGRARAEQQAAAARTAAWAQGGQLAIAESAAYAENATRLKAVDQAKQQVTRTTGRLNTAFQTFALTSAGLPGPLGRVASSLGALAVGGGVTVAVVAGIAAISAAWNALTASSREAKRATDELFASLDKAIAARQAREKPVEQLTKQLQDIEKATQAANRSIANARTIDAKTGLERIDTGAIAKANAELDKLKARQTEAFKQAQAQVVSNIESSGALAKTTVAAATATATGVKAAFGSLADFQEESARKIADAHGDTATLIAIKYAAEIRAIETDFARLSTAAQQSAKALKDEVIQALEYKQAVEQLGTVTARVVTPPSGDRLSVRGGIVTADPIAAAARQKEFEEAQKDAVRAADAALKTVTDSFQRGFAGIFKNGLSGFGQFFDSIKGLAIEAAASIAATLAVQALGIDKLIKGLTAAKSAPQQFGADGLPLAAGSGAQAAGGLGGALPVIGVGLAVAGIVGSLIGSSKAAKEAAKRMEEARAAFAKSAKSYVDEAFGFSTEFGKAVDAIIQRGEDLKKQGAASVGALPLGGSPEEIAKWVQSLKDLGKTIAEIDAATKQYIANLEAERKAKVAAVEADLNIRQLIVQGKNDEADLARFDIAQAEERKRVEKEVGEAYGQGIGARLEYVQSLEREAFVTAQATQREKELAAEREKAAAKAAEGRAFNIQLIQDEARQSGDAEQIRLAYLAGLKEEQDVKREAARKLLEDGTITQEAFDRFDTVLTNDFTDAVNSTVWAVEEASRKMQAALSHLNQEFQVFDTSLADQVTQTADLFGFTGMTNDQIRDMYTTFAESGGNLTPEQKALNDNITTYLSLEKRYRDSIPVTGSDVANGERTLPRGATGPSSVVNNVQVDIHVDSNNLANALRVGRAVAAEVNRELGGRASLAKGAAGVR